MDYMGDTRLGNINDRIKRQESYFYYISVARRKGYMYDHCTFERNYPRSNI
jgi:hypothetical protein